MTISCVSGDGSGNVIGSPGANPTPLANVVDGGTGGGAVARCAEIPVGPWFRSEGTKALWPNFVAPSDGAEWIFPIPTGTSGVYSVIVSQHGDDAASVPANLAAVVYDNETGQARSSNDVIDAPSSEKHSLGVRPPDSHEGDTVTLVLQAPSAAPGADAGLWVWSSPSCD